MRINLFIAFIVSTFLCSRVVDAASLFTPQKVYWIYIIPALFLVLAIFYKKLGFLKSVISKIFLVLFTAIPYLVLMFFILLCIVNYPPEGKFEPKLRPEVVSEQEISAGKTLDNLLKEFENKIDTNEKALISKFEVTDFNKPDIIELLKKTESNRTEIFEFISKNSIAIPHIPDTESKYYLSSDSEDYTTNLPILVSMFKVGLLEVETLRTEEKHDEAVEKYISLWSNLADAYKLKNTYIIDALNLVAISKNLGDYFYDNQSFFASYDLTEIAKLKEDIIGNLDRAYRSGFANEYALFKTKLENSKDIWPLMDKNKQLRKLDEYYYSLTEYEKNPLNDLSFEKPMDFSSVKFSDLLKGYTGEVIFAISAEMFSGVSANIIQKKNELSVYFYAMDRNNRQNVPKDYFSGEEFEVVDLPDCLEIKVHTNARLDSPKKYTILK